MPGCIKMSCTVNCEMAYSSELDELKRQWETTYSSLHSIEADCWKRLNEAALSAKSDFHLPVAGTISGGIPSLRTVVLRRVWQEERKLAFHTDVRSPKVGELQLNPNISLLFYHKTHRIQLRTQGTAIVQTDGPEAWYGWNNSTGYSRRCYLSTEAPGSFSPQPSIGFPDIYRNREPTVEETVSAREHFAIVIIQVIKMDWVWLNHAGHRRAMFDYRGKEVEACWLIP